MKAITKDFPGVRALDNVSLKLRKGEVLGLIGENGAGKSTLMKILGGVYTDYEGTIEIDNKPIRFENTRQAQESEIGFIHQELSLIPELSIEENIFLGREPLKRLGVIAQKQMRFKANELLGELGFEIDTSKPVSSLNIGMQQIVEIAKALSTRVKILVMDEPTSALSSKEIEKLFEVINILKRRGVSVIYISHKLDEVLNITDRVMTLRDGKVVGEFLIKEANIDILVQTMVGRQITDYFPRVSRERGDEILSVRNFYVDHPLRIGEKIVKDVNFDLYTGEALGIFGLMGSGRSELLEALFGAFPADTQGELTINKKMVKINSPIEAIRHGMALLTEDRKTLGLILGMSMGENITLSSLNALSRFQIIDTYRERKTAQDYVARLRITPPDHWRQAALLSGGNQQKVVIGKWLLTSPRILLLDEPTRGIDIGAKVEIYKLMNELLSQGVGIIMVSSELAEVMAMSDRIIVMCQGNITAELSKEKATETSIMACATIGRKL